MGLLVVCGVPCSGKTTRAKEVVEFLQQQGVTVHLLNEEALGIDKNTAYKDAQAEKMLRGALLAEVERLVSSKTVVVCDSLNYIKGYRYELYCRARSQKTPTCVVRES